jgi:hypothetical protein
MLIGMDPLTNIAPPSTPIEGGVVAPGGKVLATEIDIVTEIATDIRFTNK